MTKKHLRHGYTTGACAAAAAKGAALMLHFQRQVDEVEISLPAGETARFTLRGREFGPDSAACFVIKDAGDDPDVTNGAEIHAAVSLNPPSPPFTKGGNVIIEGGAGIGRVTKPGLAVLVGEWAINPVPRRMIEEALGEVFDGRRPPSAVHCRLSIPNGEELAKKTLNERLGIVGGLSILGTTGIVKPISAKAWTDTIDAAIDVALACGSSMVVLSTGRTSEIVAQSFVEQPLLKGAPEEAFVMMGDHVGYAIRACAGKGVRQVVLAGQFAKLLKIACGHEQTHVSSSELDLAMLHEWLLRDPGSSYLAPLAERANTARHALEASNNDPLLMELVCGKALGFAKKLAGGAEIKVLLAGYHSEVLYFR